MIKILAKYTQGSPLDVRAVDTMQGSYLTELREAGFLDFVASEQPQCEAGFVAVDSFEIKDGKIIQSWQVCKDTRAIQKEIEALKQALAESDYKVTKCYECALVGENAPYDIQELHRERQQLRDEINRLESDT